MRKIPTMFARSDDRRTVIDQVTPGCEWVTAGEGVGTYKYDGTCVHVSNNDGVLIVWTRREVKFGSLRPEGFIEVDHDDTTGKTVGWEPAEASGFSKFIDEATDQFNGPTGTYELIGPKINGNPEGVNTHRLMSHAAAPIIQAPRDYNGLRAFLADFNGEGIVWHHPDGRMAKIKRRDFGHR